MIAREKRDAHRWREQGSGEQRQKKEWFENMRGAERRGVHVRGLGIESSMVVLETACFLGGGLCLQVLNINSSHLSVPMPTMNNKSSTQRCQRSELLIHNHRLALALSVRLSPLWAAATFRMLKLGCTLVLTYWN